jgi:hypothetical protein
MFARTFASAASPKTHAPASPSFGRGRCPHTGGPNDSFGLEAPIPVDDTVRRMCTFCLTCAGSAAQWTHREWLDGLADLPELPQALIDHLDKLKGDSRRSEGAQGERLEEEPLPEWFTDIPDDEESLAMIQAIAQATSFTGDDLLGDFGFLP